MARPAIFEFFARLVGRDSLPLSAAEIYEAWDGMAVSRMCFNACVNLVAGAVSKCEFRTYHDGEEVKGSEYYLWNVQPNANQGASAFVREAIAALFERNEVLVIEGKGAQKGQLFVADSFGKEEKGTKETVFTDVHVNAEMVSRRLPQNKAIYLKLASENVKHLVDAIYAQYKKLLSCGMGAYRRENGNKGFIEFQHARQGDRADQEKLEERMQEQFRKFFSADSAVMRLYNGEKFTPLGGRSPSGRSDSRDVRALVNDVMDYTATAFGIPPKLMFGEVENTSNAVDQFLTFCIDPLADMLAEEINRKRYGEAEFLSGNRIKIDTKAVKHIDLLSVASAVDKLIGSGAFTIDDIRKAVGDEPIGELWSRQHYITKNYSLISDAYEPAGDGDGERRNESL
jgi:HK97 family phage portal protein